MQGIDLRGSRMQRVHSTILATSQQFLHDKVLNVLLSTIVKMKTIHAHYVINKKNLKKK